MVCRLPGDVRPSRGRAVHRAARPRLSRRWGIESGARLLLVELAHQRQREERAHVLEPRANLETDPIPARITLDVLHVDLRLTERLAAAKMLREVFLLRDVLADPLVQLAIEIALFLPA